MTQRIYVAAAIVTILSSLFGLFKVGAKLNAKANADVRSSYALERIAQDMDRLAERADRGGLPRPSLLDPDAGKSMEERATKTADEVDRELRGYLDQAKTFMPYTCGALTKDECADLMKP